MADRSRRGCSGHLGRWERRHPAGALVCSNKLAGSMPAFPGNPKSKIENPKSKMFGTQRIVVVMPAYNAAATLKRTYDEVMDEGLADLVVVVDDGSHDDTVAIARTLPQVLVHAHPSNQGYGANQKSCYRLALENAADIVVMIHPDYQYTPKLLPAMVSIVARGLHPCVLASRILGGYALKGGMPWWRYVGNRVLTLLENLLLGAKLSEYHTGYRAFSREILE